MVILEQVARETVRDLDVGRQTTMHQNFYMALRALTQLPQHDSAAGPSR